MKKILAFMAVLLFISTSSFLSPLHSSLSKEERKYAAGLLKETKKYFLKNIKGLSNAQLNFKAAPENGASGNVWSI